MSTSLFGNTTLLAGTVGANQTWDFTTSTFTAAGSQSYEACNASNNCSTFPGTTVVANTIASSGGYAYYAGSSTALSIKGIAAGSVNIVYSDAEDLYRFPITYGNSYVDTWSATFVSGGVNFYRKGNDSVSADGWGTLKTPAGTYPNTLRIKRIQTYTDSANMAGMPIIITYKGTVYTWNDIAHKDYLFNTSSLTTTPQGGSPSTTSYSRYTTQTVGIPATTRNNINWTVAPNPARDRAQVTIDVNTASTIAISLTDVSGRVVRTVPAAILPAGTNKVNISLDGLSAGVYSLRILSGSDVVTGKMIVE
jgi:hypothetical protein